MISGVREEFDATSSISHKECLSVHCKKEGGELLIDQQTIENDDVTVWPPKRRAIKPTHSIHYPHRRSASPAGQRASPPKNERTRVQMAKAGCGEKY